MLLRHFQALIRHGKVGDKPVLSTTRPEGFGTGGQVEQQQQEQLNGRQTPRQGQPRIMFHIPVLLEELQLCRVTHKEARHPLLPSAAPTLLCPPQPLDFSLP